MGAAAEACTAPPCAGLTPSMRTRSGHGTVQALHPCTAPANVCAASGVPVNAGASY